MESIKETFNGWLAGLQNYINSFSVEEKKTKIFYFSKFSIVISEFYQIYKFVKTLKENIFKSLIEQFKFCVKELIAFSNPNLSIKEKVIILYSSCLLIYYKKFCFNTNNSFEDFFDDDFIYITTTTFGYQIVNEELFKTFIFYTYSKIKKEINELDYTPIQNLKKYYYTENNSVKNSNNINNINNESSNIEHSKNNKNNSSGISTNNSINNDYFPDPNIFLPRKKTHNNQKNINIKRPNNIKLNINKNINADLDLNSKNNIINLNENEIEDDKIDDSNTINNSSQKENFGFQEQVLTYLTSTKERIINLAFEMTYKGYFPIFNKNINDRFQEFNNMSSNKFDIVNKTEENSSSINDFPQKPKTLNVNKNSINSINKKINKNEFNTINNINQKLKPDVKHFSNQDTINFENPHIKNNEMEIENDLNNINDDDSHNNSKESEKNVNNSFFSTDIYTCCNFESLYNYYANNSKDNTKIENISSNNNNNKYTKTIIRELSKYEVDEQIVKIIEEVAKKIDSNYLGQTVNNSPKNVTLINYFSCYMVEFSPDKLQNIEPKYKDILQNYCIKFIVLAKELYNTAMELFTTIYDLSFTNIDTFINLSKNCGIQIQYAQSLYSMFKEYSTLLLKKKESNIKNILQKLFKQQKSLWDKSIIQKSNELTSFYKVQNV